MIQKFCLSCNNLVVGRRSFAKFCLECRPIKFRPRVNVVCVSCSETFSAKGKWKKYCDGCEEVKKAATTSGKKRLQDRLKENKRALHDGEEILCKQCSNPITSRHWNSIYCIECRPSRPKSPVENNGHAILKRTVNCNLCLSAHDYTSDAARSVCGGCNEKKLNQSYLFFPWKTDKLGEHYADVIHPESGPLSVVVSTQITGFSWRSIWIHGRTGYGKWRSAFRDRHHD